MGTWRVNNSTLLGGEVCAQWQLNHAYSLGARVVPRSAYGTAAAKKFVYECTTAGTSHASTEPTWPTTVGNTVNDNGVVWTCRSPSDGSWDNASAHLSYITNNGAAAGDSIYVHNAHNETCPDNYIWGSSNFANPIMIFCVNKDSADALSTGAAVTSALSAVSLEYFLYSYGVTFGNSAAGGQFQIGKNAAYNIILEGNGTDVLKLTGANGYISLDPVFSVGILTIINGNLNFNATNQSAKFYGGTLVWRGGTMTCPSGITNVFSNSNNYAPKCRISDVDFSAVGSGKIFTSDARPADFLLERCKFPTDGSFLPVSGLPTHPQVPAYRFHHCSGANNTYAFSEHYYEGKIQQETTIVRSGGASDGATPISHKMISSENVKDNINPLHGPRIYGWTNSTTSKTFTIECIFDGLTNLQNDEVWMEFEYPVNNTDGLGGFARDKCAPLGTPADKPSSSVTWTTTGLTNPNKFKCQVTVTPGKAGPITARICLAKPSTTIYADPKITES